MHSKDLKGILALAVLLFIAFGAFSALRSVAQRRVEQRVRLLFVTDRYFDELVYSRLNRELEAFCKRHNYYLEKTVISVQDDPQVAFVSSFDTITKIDTAAVVLSPFASVLFIDNNNIDIDNKIDISALHYRPIIIGFGNKSNNSAFDLMFDMDTSLVFQDIDVLVSRIKKAGKKAFAYSEDDFRSRFSSDDITQVLIEKIKSGFDNCINASRVLYENRDSYLNGYDTIVSTGYRQFGNYIEHLLPSQKIVLPYYADFLEHGYYSIVPDVIWAMEYSLRNYNAQSGCQNVDMKYTLRYVK